MAIKVAVKIKLMIGLIVRHGDNCQSDNDMIMAVVKIRGLHDVITILDNCHHHYTHYYHHHFDHHHHRYHHQDASHR